MRNTKFGTLAVGMALASSLALVACGGSNSAASSAAATSEATSATSAEATSAAATSTTAAATDLVSYVRSPEATEFIEKMIDTSSFEAIGTVEKTVDGNTLAYTITVGEALDKSPVDDSTFNEETAKVFAAAVAEIEKASGLTGLNLKFDFLDSTGHLWYTITFDNAGITHQQLSTVE